MKARHLLLIFSYLFFLNYSYAQEFQIKGLLTEENGLPLAGAIVENLKSKVKVSANFDGEYEITAKTGDTLKFYGSEKLKNCFEVKYFTVSNNENINVEILSKESLKNQLCKNIPKEFYIFIGKRISSETDYSYDECFINMNTNIVAAFEVVEQFYGNLNMKSITFKDSDHASIEPFPYLDTEYSLLFIVKYCDEYYLRYSKKIFETKNDEWALMYHPKNYLEIKGGSSHIETIHFKNKVKIKGRYNPNNLYPEYFDAPYYKQKSNYLKPLMGNYAKDYVALWLENNSEFTNRNANED